MKSLDARLALLERAEPPEWTISVTVVAAGTPRPDPLPGVRVIWISPHGEQDPPGPTDLT